jgi:hypothetical protein
MIARKREMIVTEGEPDVIIVDGSQTLFSIKKPDHPPIEGLRTQHAKGKLITRLDRLTNLLVAYCKANVVQRPAIAKQIERNARRLISDVTVLDRR